MFNRIAPHYDLLNRVLSLRRDVAWRRALVDSLKVPQQAGVLDVACGTADVALQVAAQYPLAQVVGVDFAPRMLARALSKIKGRAVCLAAADAFALPFGRGCFDAITIAFGIRNIQDKVTVLHCFYDHLKPEGRLAVLELALPDRSILRRIYLFYFNRLLPLLGRLFSGHAFAYTYLPASVAQFPPAEVFAGMMRSAGFKRVGYSKLTLGLAVLFIGEK
ncbi:MAG: ubiquinone/menaquinone biosynthesis methyltransferase [Desulfobacteraceae bacterium]|nr:MAG: ubiquinone/menaquinone biosynthesis methyltransferase [Desulfobacteraceae bacterium]